MTCAQPLQQIAVPRLAADKVFLHGRLCRLTVAARNGKDDVLMFLDQLFMIAALNLTDGAGDQLRSRHGTFAVGLEDAGELRIIGGLGDGKVQGEIGLAEGLASLDAAHERGVTIEDMLLLRRRAPLRRQPRRRDFQRRAHLQNFKNLREARAFRRPVCSGGVGRLDHEDARALRAEGLVEARHTTVRLTP
mgnify:CR=1 FL=1